MECALLLILAYSSYLISDALRLSGIVTIVFCGITMAHYTWLNLSPQTQVCQILFLFVLRMTDLFDFFFQKNDFVANVFGHVCCDRITL